MNDLPLCAGGCGKRLRPQRATIDQYPGSVRTESRGRCQPCAVLVATHDAPQRKPRTGKCATCKRPMRPRGSRAPDFPGTIMEYDANRCATCWRHATYGPPKPLQEPEFNPWGDCSLCDRSMRPKRAKRSEAPGTVQHHARGICVTCTRLEADPDRKRGPMIVGAPKTVEPEVAPEPEAEVEITDPGVLRFTQERAERLRRQEQMRRLRIGQEAARARFIAMRNAA